MASEYDALLEAVRPRSEYDALIDAVNSDSGQTTQPVPYSKEDNNPLFSDDDSAERARIGQGLQWLMRQPGKALVAASGVFHPGGPVLHWPTDKEVDKPLMSPEAARAVAGVASGGMTEAMRLSKQISPQSILPQVASGVAEGETDAVQSFSSPANIALLPILPSGGIPGKLVAGLFLGQAIQGTPEQWKQLNETPNLSDKIRIATQMGLGYALPAAGFLHAKGEVPTKSDVVPPIETEPKLTTQEQAQQISPSVSQEEVLQQPPAPSALPQRDRVISGSQSVSHQESPRAVTQELSQPDVNIVGEPEQASSVQRPSDAGAPLISKEEPVVRPETPIAEVSTETATPQNALSFVTAKGSEYTVHEDGTTTRNKSVHPEHPGDEGLKPRSEATFYVTPEQAVNLAEVQARGIQTELAQLPDGRWGMRYTAGPNAGKFEARTVTKASTTPAVGLQPVEIWKGEKPHFGNPITEVREPQNAPEPTSTKNAVVEAEREARGIQPAEDVAKREFGEVWKEAEDHLANDPDAGQRLVAEITAKPRALTDKENAILLCRQIEAQAEHDAAVKAVNEATDDASRMDATARLERARDDVQAVYDAGKVAGTETGRGLNARKMLANDDFSLAKMEATTRAIVNDGKPLSPRQAANVAALHERIRVAERRLAEYETRERFNDLIREAQKEARARKASGKTHKSFLEERAAKARERIKEMPGVCSL